MSTGLRKKKTNDFEKHLFNLMNSAIFGKSIENNRKHGDIKLATEKRRIYLALERNYHTT